MLHFGLRKLICLTAVLQLAAAGPGFRPAVPGYHYQFPRDHFGHPDFRTEWWYYTGNVRATTGHQYGFELVFFRQGQRRGPNDNPSTWRADDLYLAHLALTDIDGKRFRYYTRLNRAGPGIAGVSLNEFHTVIGAYESQLAVGRIWNGNWEVRWDIETGTQTLTAVAAEIRFQLRLTPRKPAVINGENGVSRKGEGEGEASYYVSFPKLEVEGMLNGAQVTGSAWMDHEWFSSQLSPNQVGWDWFSIQLANNTELMLFDLRRADGSVDPYSSGTYIDRTGRSIHLKRSDFQLEPLDTWKSGKTGARYPTRWRITVPSLSLTLECATAVPDQELVSETEGVSTYWEGAVTYNGTVNGVGYLEMTGYNKPVRL